MWQEVVAMVLILNIFNYSVYEELGDERRYYLCSEAEGIVGIYLQVTLSFL